MSSFNNSFLNKKLDHLLNQLKCAAKVILAVRFLLNNFEGGLCRYSNAHKNNTVMEKPKLECTQDDMVNLKKKLKKMVVVDLCTGDRAHTKWRFHKLTDVTVFASLLKNKPMGCKGTVLLEPLSRSHNVDCLTFERNTRQP